MTRYEIRVTRVTSQIYTFFPFLDEKKKGTKEFRFAPVDRHLLLSNTGQLSGNRERGIRKEHGSLRLGRDRGDAVIIAVDNGSVNEP